MRKFDKVSAGLSFSPRYCRADAEKAIIYLVFIYREAMSIFWGQKCPKFSIFLGFSKIYCV